jgi:hypothetical protein
MEWKKKISPQGDVLLCRSPHFGIDAVNPSLSAKKNIATSQVAFLFSGQTVKLA